MKSWVRMIFIVIIFIIIVDVISFFVMDRPLFAIKSDNMYKGLFFDVYDCQYNSSATIKLKWDRVICDTNDNSSEIAMSIKKGSLSREGATIIIKDTSGDDNVYGLYYRIEKMIDGNWSKLKTINDSVIWNDIGYSVGKNNLLELEIDWKWLYGELSDGKYRLIKNISSNDELSDKYVMVEFEIS